MCITLMVLFLTLYEVGFILLYNGVRKKHAEMTLWVIMGSKVCKLFVACAMLVCVKMFTEESLTRFAIALLIALLISILIESAYCIRKRDNEETKVK